MAVMGRKLLAASGQWILIDDDANNQVGTTLPVFVALVPLHITRIGMFARRSSGVSSGTARGWLAIYSLDGSGAPDVELARTSRLSITNSAAGGDVSGAVTWVNPALGQVSQGALRLAPGTAFAVAGKIEGQDAEIAYAAGNGVDSATFYRRTHAAGNTPPANPFGATSTAVDLAPSFYTEYEENVAPSVALGGPADGAALATTTPIFSASFLDAQSAAPIADAMSAYEIEVFDNTTGVALWAGPGAVFPASVAERAAGNFARVYAGAALAGGATIYGWRAYVYDQSGVRSPASAVRTFTISARGVIDVATDAAPTGKVDTDSALLDWVGRWSHPSAHPMDRVQVRIYRNGLLFRAGVEVAKAIAGTAIAPGNLFTVLDSEAGIGALPAGDYTYTLAGRSQTDLLWSPESDPVAFTINSRPTMPSNLQPPAGAVSTAYPFLEWDVTDPNADDVFGVDADSELQFVSPTGVSTFFTTTNYDAVRKRGFLQTNGAHVSAVGLWQWRARGRDTSAGALGIGEWSQFSTFTYAAGPVVTIVSPADGALVASSVPNVAWTNTGGAQTRARVVLYAEDSRTPLKAQDISGSTQNLQIPVGWLKRGNAYDLAVTVWVAGEVSGTSLRRAFSVGYTNPVAPSDVSATPFAEPFDYYAAPSSILISAGIAPYSPGEDGGINIYRRLATQSEGEATLLRTLRVPGQRQWRDVWAPSNTLLLYGVSQLRKDGADVLESDIVWVEAEIALVVPILVSAFDPSLRFPCMYMERDYSGKRGRPRAKYFTWGSGNKRVVVTTPVATSSRTVKMSVTIKSDARGHLYEHQAQLENLLDSGHPVLFRTENPTERGYFDVEAEWSRGGVGERVIKLALEEIDFTPGEQGGS